MSHRGERNDMDIEMLQAQIDALKDEVSDLRKRVDSLVPQLPWHEAPSWAKWAAQDVADDWYWYEHEPDIDACGMWWVECGSMEKFEHPARVDYKYSKQCRP